MILQHRCKNKFEVFFFSVLLACTSQSVNTPLLGHVWNVYITHILVYDSHSSPYNFTYVSLHVSPSFWQNLVQVRWSSFSNMTDAVNRFSYVWTKHCHKQVRYDLCHRCSIMPWSACPYSLPIVSVICGVIPDTFLITPHIYIVLHFIRYIKYHSKFFLLKINKSLLGKQY